MTASRTDRSLSETTAITDDVSTGRLTVFRIALLVAVAHFAAVALDPTLPALLVVEAVIGAVLVAVELWDSRSIERTLALGLVFAAVSGGAWLALWQGIDAWLVAGSLLVGFGLLGYGLYRYQRVIHGTVAGATEANVGDSDEH